MSQHPPSAPLRILVADDEAAIRDVVTFALEREGFVITEARDGREALALFDQDSPALVVLDVLMPEMDGLSVCRALRTKTRVPIIFLSSRDDEIDRILGLELGGDDYITKPFSPRELVARVRAVLRRWADTQTPPSPSTPKKTITHGPLVLDLDRFSVAWAGAEVVLTATEFNLLKTLARYPGKVFSRDELMDGAYQGEVFVSPRTIDSHLRRIRAKLEAAGAPPDAGIETVHGLGYRLLDAPARR